MQLFSPKKITFIQGLIIVGLLTFIATLFIHFQLSPFAWLHWDEGVFVHWGYKIFIPLYNHDWTKFLAATNSHMWSLYPPLQSWFLGIVLQPFGYTFENVRTVSHLWFILGSVLTFYLGTKITKRYAIITGILAAIFYLTAPGILYLGSIAMKELIGVVFTILFFILYIHARERGRIISFLLSSFILFILFMTKYQYFIIPLLTAGFDLFFLFLTSAWKKKRKVISYGLLTVIPFCLLSGVWIFLPENKFDQVFASFLNMPPPLPGAPLVSVTDTINTILFYPRSIFYFYTFSQLLGGCFLLSLVLSILYFRNFRVRLLWLAVAINMFFAATHIYNLAYRYLSNTIPYVFILTSIVLVDVICRLQNIRPRVISHGVLIILIPIGGFFIGRDFLQLQQYVYSSTSQSGMAFNMLDYKDNVVNYDLSTWPKADPRLMKENPRDVLEYIAQNVNLSAPVDVVGTSSELSPEYVAMFFNTFINSGKLIPYPYSNYLVTIEILPSSRLYTHIFQVTSKLIPYNFGDGAATVDQIIQNVSNNPEKVLWKTKLFSELGVEVKIYVPTSEYYR